MKRAALSVSLLTALYALVLASLKPWDLFLGLLLSGGLVYAYRRRAHGEAGDEPDSSPGLPGRLLAFFPFAWAVLKDVVSGTWEVALVVLHARPLERSGIVRVPVGERTPTGVAVTALVTTLSPGAFLVDANQEFMWIHLLDASDPDGFREEREELYQRYQRKVFP